MAKKTDPEAELLDDAEGRPRTPVIVDPDHPEAGGGGVVPPAEHRFQPGKSGNPKGRPKGARTRLEKVFEQELSRYVDLDDTDSGERISRRRRLVRAILDCAEAGDARVIRELLNRFFPPPPKPEAAPSVVVLNFDEQDRNA